MRSIQIQSLLAEEWVTIERWTIERFDQDAGMARIEIVPIHPEYQADLLKRLKAKKGLVAGIDNLSCWNVQRARVRRMTIRGLAKKIFGAARQRELSENMVFWAFIPKNRKKSSRVLHATRAARKLSKQVYASVT
jgi:hypothetical protein